MENIIEIAADWFEKYLADGNTIDDWCRDSENVESGREKFYREMGFKPTFCIVDDIIRPQKDDAKWRTQLSLEFTL